MANDDRWWDDDEDDSNSKEKVEELANEAEANRIKREEELAKAEHELRIAELENETASKTEESSEEDDGVLGLWWLSPAEAVAVVGAGIFCLMALVFGMSLVANAGGYEPVSAEILEAYPGYDWIEKEDCYTDDWGDQYCDYWYELHCWADIDVAYSIGNMSYFAELDGVGIGNYGDYTGAEDDCLAEAESSHLAVGSSITIYYDTEDPTDISIDNPLDGAWIGAICCGTISLIFLISVLVFARLNNEEGGDGGGVYEAGGGSGGTVNVVHHHHGGSWGWGPMRIWRGGGPRRSHRRRSRRVVSRSGGRRSGGGGRRSGGGGRRSGGGRRR